jgi:hypothetical protein
MFGTDYDDLDTTHTINMVTLAYRVMHLANDEPHPRWFNTLSAILDELQKSQQHPSENHFFLVSDPKDSKKVLFGYRRGTESEQEIYMSEKQAKAISDSIPRLRT